jgi:ABC-2 type transport system permease protein
LFFQTQACLILDMLHSKVFFWSCALGFALPYSYYHLLRSFADEYKAGTFELLKTLPVTPAQIVVGKFFGALLIVLLALIPTTIYAFSLQHLSSLGGIDAGASMGSYIGLFLLGSVFTSVGLCASSFTNNTVIAFIGAAFLCLVLYTGFEALGSLPFFANGKDYYVEMLGINFHYKSISKGVIDIRDIIYFLALITFFIATTKRNLQIR